MRTLVIACRTWQALSVIVRAGQVIAAHRTNELAALRLKPLRANRTKTDGMLYALPLLFRI
jgi:hypothetical protein